MQTLNDLMTAAMQLAGTDDQISHNARLWQMEGGRACPLGWGGCSQAVYVDLKTGEYDYGKPGGPGHADCVRHCSHGMQPVHNVDFTGAGTASGGKKGSGSSLARRKETDMATPKTHDWQHDGEYCHHRHTDEEGDAARSVCEGMYAAKEDEKLALKQALRAVYALAGENPEVRKIINDALDEDE